MQLLFVPPNNWMTHPNPMRHHFLFGRLAENHGCKVYVINYDGLGNSTSVINPELVFHDGIQMIHQHSLPITDPALYYILNSKNTWDAIRHTLEQLHIDAVVNSNIVPGVMASILAKRMKIPLVYDCAEYYPESASAYFKSRSLKLLAQNVVKEAMKYVIRRSDAVITVSDSHARLVKDVDPGSAVHVVPNGVDLRLFRQFSTSQSSVHGVSSTRELRLVYVGSVDEWLDMESVIRAIKNLSGELRIVLTIVGGSHGEFYLSHLMSLVKSWKLEEQVRFMGFVPYHLVPSYVASADAALSPYKILLKNDVSPLKIPEYLACGKIVLSTPVPEITRRFGDLVYFYDSTEGLSHLLRRIFSDRALMEKRTQGAKDILEGYSWDTIAERYYQIIRLAISGSAKV